MAKTRIVIDSTVDLQEASKQRMSVVPLSVHFGDTEYMDGVNITHREFYEKLIESDELPTTSQPTPAAFAKVYEEACAAGEDVVVITIASGLSGTFQSATIAAEDFADHVYVVDSRTAAIASGVLAEYALSLADQGMAAREIAEELERMRDHVCIVAMVDTLEYLRRGGRLSKAAAFAGEMLSIKPVITIANGEIQILGKARGSRRANNLLVKEIETAGGIDFEKPVLLGYTGLDDQTLKKYVEDSAFLWEGHGDALHSVMIGSAVGTHAGPGAIAAAFFHK